MRSSRSWKAVAVAAGLALLGDRARAEDESVVREAELKAEFVERFTRFVDWPSHGPEHELVLCLVGVPSFGGALERMAEKRRFRGAVARVERLPMVADPSSCHVLVLGALDPSALGVVLDACAARPVLTVADTPGFGEAGVMINLFRRGSRLGFEINLGAAERSRLRIRSKLVRLGRVVSTREGRR
jgi:hypothetical protein